MAILINGSEYRKQMKDTIIMWYPEDYKSEYTIYYHENERQTASSTISSYQYIPTIKRKYVKA